MIHLVRGPTPATSFTPWCHALAMSAPFSETERLTALFRCRILDTPSEPCLDRVSRLAAQFFVAPMAVISFVTQDRSWFKSRYGFDGLDYTELAREASFCAHTILGRDALVIPDAAADDRFAGLPVVAGPPGIHFYAGTPLVTPDGFPVGALAVMDTHPREPLSAAQLDALRDFGALVEEQLNRRSTLPAPPDDPLRRMVDELPVLIWRSDEEGRATFFSRYWHEFSGRSLAPGMDFGWLDLVHPEDRAHALAQVGADIATGAGTVFEFRVRRADGEYRCMLNQACPQFGRDGSFAGFVGVCIDITERKHAEGTRAQLAAIVQSSEQAIMSLDFDCKFLTWNPAAEKLFGYSADEVQGRSVLPLVPPDRTQEIADGVARIRAGAPTLHYETVRIRKDGAEVPVSLNISAIKNPEGRLVALSAIATDLTLLKKAEQARREFEERFRLLIEHGLEVIGVMDATATIRYVSPSVERVFGYRVGSLVGTNAFQFIHPDDRPAVQQAFETILQSPYRSESVQFRFRHSDGSWRHAESAATNCLHIAGLDGIVVNIRDITPRKIFEEQLRASRDQLRQLAAGIESTREEERLRISREIHDELGQVLSALKLDLEGLAFQRRPRDARSRNDLSERIAGLVRNIDISINTVRRIAAELRPSILNDLGLSAALKWQIQEFESRTGIPCRWQGLREGLRLGAETSLAVFRIFQETLTNVVRHADAHTVSIRVTTKGGWLTLRVADDGKGLDPKYLSDSQSLGLLGMRERALLLGGRVEFSARRGGGTVVTVQVPAFASDAAPSPLPPVQ